MRQSGVLSAACLYALDHNLDRLAQDHQHARRLADRLAGLRSLAVTPPETNIVMLDLADRAAGDAALLLEQAGVRLAVYGPRRLRAVTHLDVSAADVDHAADLITQVLT
jgi:threonine aldolase